MLPHPPRYRESQIFIVAQSVADASFRPSGENYMLSTAPEATLRPSGKKATLRQYTNDFAVSALFPPM
ncbi:hypothetical protein GB937_008399 [Aspergillus fischeri]|nr:hypothetical protein GB937_008399 [Aspergillus fischeri]